MVEDNPADVMIAEEVLATSPCATAFDAVNNGTAALKYLRKEGEYASARRPDVVWLDLKLPGLSGHDVLQAIRESRELTTLPVVVLSSSSNPIDVERAYALHANCYFVKAVDFVVYRDRLHALIDFWGRHAKLPGRAN
jgi:CheY-like chemotaxis protein